MPSDNEEMSSLAHRVSSLRNCRENPKAFPSSRWKENLRASCLQNARKRRRELLMKRRLRNDVSHSRSPGASAEDVLMEVLKERNTVMTPHTSDIKFEGIISASPSEELDPDYGTTKVHSDPRNMQDTFSDWDGHNLTDDDLYDILLEIEEELKVDDEMLLEEVLEEERTSLEYQVNEYEDWEYDMDEEERVVCPLCTASYLRLSPTGDICCSDNYCPMRVKPNDQSKPLLAFKNDLGRIFEEHSRNCNDQLVLRVCTNENGITLVMSCNSCDQCCQF
ncbi:unnamed protein product [Cylindrotheca closterium]|uniref:RPA-interacting protein C-terminal domain-containing protein n=1 Tax=Cylindrotheca closterium TaxID=2856 RepID=A0AAD2CDV1_9STRA|nr:unnamed protein product [Cylindrotheca closterium]